MGSRLFNLSLNFAFKRFGKLTLKRCECRKIHAVCLRKEIDFESRVSRVSLYCSETPKKCWQCNYPYKTELFCQKCKTLQEPAETLDYFQVLGVGRNYDVEGKEVQMKYRALQNILHPDRFGQRSEKEKRYSEELSSLVNKAYSTLTSPLDRGLYLLKLNNLEISEDTKSLEPEFLMEIMELNEDVEEASKDVEKIQRLRMKNNEKLEKLSRDVSEAFHKEDLEKAKVILAKMKYYDSLNERLKKIKQDLGIVD